MSRRVDSMERKFMKGCEAMAEAAGRAGCRFFAGSPITPQNEIPEYLSRRLPEVGGDFVQGESEIASVNMVFGAACAGVRCMTSSSSPGISLKAEGISYLAQTRLPAVIINVSRCGPGLGGILPAQSDYTFATKASGHGGFQMIVLAPHTVQEATDMVYEAFDLADRDRQPVMVLADGVIGAMMESVTLPPFRTELPDHSGWALSKMPNCGPPRQLIPMCWDGETLEKCNIEHAKLYQRWEQEELRYEEYMTQDAQHILVAYGTAARICKAVIHTLRKEGVKIGMFRPQVVNPFPYTWFDSLDYERIQTLIDVELTIPGQMLTDVKWAVKGRKNVEFFGRSGGVIPLPNEILDAVRAIIHKEGA